MAFPGTYNISYYKGDTLEFKIYPKDSSGASFSLDNYIATFTIAFILTNDVVVSSAVGIADLFAKAILYYLHERIWNKISWGRYS